MKSVIIANGGFEQAILEIVKEDGLLSEKDNKRLVYLQSLQKIELNLMVELK